MKKTASQVLLKLKKKVTYWYLRELIPLCFSMFVKPETGLLSFILFKSTHLVNAYKCGKEIVVCVLLVVIRVNNNRNT